MKRKIWGAVIYLGMFFCLLVESNNFFKTILSYIIFSIIMSIVPFIFKMSLGKINNEKGKKICLINSLIILLCVIFMFSMFRIISSLPYLYFVMLSVAWCVISIIYYFANVLLFVEPKSKKEINRDVKPLENCYFEAMKYYNSGDKETSIDMLREYINKSKSVIPRGYLTFANEVELNIYIDNYDLPKYIISNLSNAYYYLCKGDIYDSFRLEKSLKLNPVNVKSLFLDIEINEYTYTDFELYNKLFQIYNYIYDTNDLVNFYSWLAYYYYEKNNYEVCKAIYLHMINFCDKKLIMDNLNTVIDKSNDKLPTKEEVKNILEDNNIPLNISKTILKWVNHK